MNNIAILVGNSQYDNLNNLDCCHDDIQAINELLVETAKFTEIEIIEDADSNTLKSKIRETIDRHPKTDEIFFYFTGHGLLQEDEFYFCAKNFDQKRPNETGLSNDELHTLFKTSDSQVVVKVIDACNSGTLLIKSTSPLVAAEKHGFNNLIQISSCQETQNSLTGNPLSLFTDKFCKAAVRKTEGQVYYTDIINTLRDEFLDNDLQTPFFVSQATGREKFVDDASCFNELRLKYNTQDQDQDNNANSNSPSQTQPTLLDLVSEADSKLVTRETIQKFVGNLFDDLIETLSVGQFSDFFDIQLTEHSSFEEKTAESFITRILSKQNRLDDFVTARITRTRKKPNPWGIDNYTGGLLGAFDEYTESEFLQLNCEMQRAQLKITLAPKFHILKQLILVVSCAPSLEHCYVFEITTQHSLRDFGKFDSFGETVVQRWYKMDWNQNTENLVRKISNQLIEIVEAHIESLTKKRESDG